jgi:hypothetical protein
MFTSSAWVGLALGTILQMAMVIAGHYVAAISLLFAPIGVLVSLVAGLVYAARAGRGAATERLLVGAVVGGGCALIGIAVSWALHDVPALILVVGTASSAVSGALGAAIGRVWGK